MCLEQAKSYQFCFEKFGNIKEGTKCNRRHHIGSNSLANADPLGCLICPFLSQIISASISSGHLWIQDTQNIFFFFAKNIFLRSPKDPLSIKKWISKLLR